jgi:uncharacterized tellurite resistance protein B-like protein
MPEIVLIVLALLVAVSTVALVTLYLRYVGTPAAQWKQRVRAAVESHENQIRAARADLARLDRADDIRLLRDKYLRRHLAGIAVEELIRFPGIGPVTVSKIRDAGLSNLDSLSRATLTAIAGIGPARANDLREAMRQLGRDAESRFDAGACAEAVAFAEERKQREADNQRRRQEAEQRMQSAKSALTALADVTRMAREVSFFGYLLRRESPGLTAEVMARPLPSVSHGGGSVATSQGDLSSSPSPLRGGGRGEGSVATSQGDLPSSPSPLRGGGRPEVSVATPQPVHSPVDQLRAVAAFGYAVAKADGRIAASERRQVRAFVERRYACAADLAKQLDTLLAEVESRIPSLHDAIVDIKRMIPNAAWPELYQFAVSVADAAGERNTREIECLARVAEELGIGVKPATPPEPAPAPTPVADAPLTENDCRLALEIAPETPLSVDLVRRQYRLLSDRFAPERFASHGPEFIRMAAEKRERVERAARHLLAEYNEPLEPPAAAPPTDLRHNPDLDEVFGA